MDVELNDAALKAGPADVCPNCAGMLPDGMQHCPQCGQPRSHRLTVRYVLRELRTKVAGLDFRTIRTFRDLLLRPGVAARGFVQGRRRYYANPIAYAFIAMTLFIATNNLITRSVARIFDPLVSYRAFWPYLLFVLIIPAVALQRLIFRQSGYNFAETYTFALLVCGQLMLVETTYLPFASQAWPWGRVALGSAEAAYFAWAITGFVDRRTASVWARGVLAFAAYAGSAVGVLYLLVSSLTSMMAEL